MALHHLQNKVQIPKSGTQKGPYQIGHWPFLFSLLSFLLPRPPTHLLFWPPRNSYGPFPLPGTRMHRPLPQTTTGKGEDHLWECLLGAAPWTPDPDQGASSFCVSSHHPGSWVHRTISSLHCLPLGNSDFCVSCLSTPHDYQGPSTSLSVWQTPWWVKVSVLLPQAYTLGSSSQGP